MKSIILQKKELIDIFDADDCSIALGRKMRDSADVSELSELGGGNDELDLIINEMGELI